MERRLRPPFPFEEKRPSGRAACAEHAGHVCSPSRPPFFAAFGGPGEHHDPQPARATAVSHTTARAVGACAGPPFLTLTKQD